MARDEIQLRPLEGVRVLDLAEGPAALCGKLLAQLGATCVKVEKPRGEQGRWLQEYTLGDASEEGRNSAFDYWNSGKQGIVLDLTSEDDVKWFHRLISCSDVAVDSFDPQNRKNLGLTAPQLWRINPTILPVSITPFGIHGPYARYKANDLVCQAMGGLMNLYGDANRSPLAAPCDQALQLGALAAAYGVLAALRYRNIEGKAQEVEAAVQEIAASNWYQLVNYAGNSAIIRRSGDRRPYGGAAPMGIYPARDGFFHIMIMSRQHWKTLVEWMGNPETLKDPIWENRHFRTQNYDVIDPFVVEFFKHLSKMEIFLEGQRRGLVVAPINKLGDFPYDEHVLSRDFFYGEPRVQGGQKIWAGAPFKLSATPCFLSNTAPSLSEHTKTVCTDTFDWFLSKSRWRQSGDRQRATRAGGQTPMSDIRVIDLTMAVAGPTMTRIFSELGADVIRIESVTHPQRGKKSEALDEAILRQQVFTYAELNRNKRSFALNLNRPQGKDLFVKLVNASDIVATSISPAVLERWGITYDQLRKIKPDIIMVCLTGFGLTGPYRNLRSAAPTSTALTGLYDLWSYRDSEKPVGSPVWHTDTATALHGAIGALAALLYRDLTGYGQLVDVAQIESTGTLLGPLFLECGRTRGELDLRGNHSPRFAPYGCYRCKGDDRWCVLAVRTDDEWKGLCRAIGTIGLVDDPRFSTLQNRLIHRQALDTLIEGWTNELSPFQVMRLLQKEGVPAGVVQNGEDLFHDINLRARGFMANISQPEIGSVEYPGCLVRLSKTPGILGRCSEMGEDNPFVLEELLGVASPDVEVLRQQEVTV